MPQTVALVMIYLDMTVTVALEYSFLHNAEENSAWNQLGFDTDGISRLVFFKNQLYTVDQLSVIYMFCCRYMHVLFLCR